MTWKNEILKPEVTLNPAGVKDIFEIPKHATFHVKITFVDPKYPVCEYDTKTRATFETLEASETALMASLEAKVLAWKAKHDFLQNKQALIEDSLNNPLNDWGTI